MLLLNLLHNELQCLNASLVFFYDIFWVFGTEVMVSVAKGVDGPIKLLFPRSFKQVRPRPSPPASAVARKILSFVFETRR